MEAPDVRRRTAPVFDLGFASSVKHVSFIEGNEKQLSDSAMNPCYANDSLGSLRRSARCGVFIKLEPHAAAAMDHGADILFENHQRLGTRARNQKCDPSLHRISGSDGASQTRLWLRGQGRGVVLFSVGCRRSELGLVDCVAVMERPGPRGKFEPDAREEIFEANTKI